jgi:hypothetical protein
MEGHTAMKIWPFSGKKLITNDMDEDDTSSDANSRGAMIRRHTAATKPPDLPRGTSGVSPSGDGKR